MGLRKNGARKGDTRVDPLTSLPSKRLLATQAIHSRVSPSRAPVLSRAQILLSVCHAGYVQYGLFSRDDVNSNVFLQFATANVKCTKSFEKNFCKIKRF